MLTSAMVNKATLGAQREGEMREAQGDTGEISISVSQRHPWGYCGNRGRFRVMEVSGYTVVGRASSWIDSRARCLPAVESRARRPWK
jgi:hypothetical protein